MCNVIKKVLNISVAWKSRQAQKRIRSRRRAKAINTNITLAVFGLTGSGGDRLISIAEQD